jgi:hypothetical protein
MGKFLDDLCSFGIAGQMQSNNCVPCEPIVLVSETVHNSSATAGQIAPKPIRSRWNANADPFPPQQFAGSIPRSKLSSPAAVPPWRKSSRRGVGQVFQDWDYPSTDRDLIQDVERSFRGTASKSLDGTGLIPQESAGTWGRMQENGSSGTHMNHPTDI